MEVIRINETDIFLDDMGDGKGKITISNTDSHNYSHYWGAMGEHSLKSFLLKINESYFVGKLLGSSSGLEFCEKRTLRNIRKFIREEGNMPWYKHMEFQKEMRVELKEAFMDCYNIDSFMSCWDYFVRNLDYYLIKDEYDRKEIESFFKYADEVWYLMGQKPNRNMIFLKKLFKDLKKEIKNNGI